MCQIYIPHKSQHLSHIHPTTCTPYTLPTCILYTYRTSTYLLISYTHTRHTHITLTIHPIHAYHTHTTGTHYITHTCPHIHMHTHCTPHRYTQFPFLPLSLCLHYAFCDTNTHTQPNGEALGHMSQPEVSEQTSAWSWLPARKELFSLIFKFREVSISETLTPPQTAKERTRTTGNKEIFCWDKCQRKATFKYIFNQIL